MFVIGLVFGYDVVFAVLETKFIFSLVDVIAVDTIVWENIVVAGE